MKVNATSILSHLCVNPLCHVCMWTCFVTLVSPWMSVADLRVSRFIFSLCPDDSITLLTKTAAYPVRTEPKMKSSLQRVYMCLCLCVCVRACACIPGTEWAVRWWESRQCKDWQTKRYLPCLRICFVPVCSLNIDEIGSPVWKSYRPALTIFVSNSELAP